jgi:PST family polysaccharide transporter
MPAPDARIDETASVVVDHTDAPKAGLTGVLRRGATISAAALIFTQALSFAQTLALARILTPLEVGVFYSGTVLTSFLASFSEGGLKNALIQRQQDVERTAATVFWATFGTSILGGLIALAAAPVVGAVFHSGTVTAVAAATAGAVVLHGLTNVPDALMQRRFDFRQRIFVQPSTALTFAVASVVLCLAGLGVWGLVVAYYLSIVVWLIVTWSLARWRPRRGQASVALWRELARFSFPLVVRSTATRVKDILDAAIVGRVLDTAAVGNYRYGSRLGTLPGLVIIEVGSYVLFPAFSRTSSDPVRFRSAFLRSLRALWLLATPLAALTAFLGAPAAVLLLGEPWRDAGYMFSSMSGIGLGVAMSAAGFEAIKGAGRTTLLNWVTVVELLVGVSALLALVHIGPVGVGVALSVTTLCSGSVGLWQVRKVVEVSVRDIVGCLATPALVAAVAAVPWWLLEAQVQRSETHGTLVGLALIAADSVGYLVTFAGLLLLVSPSSRALVRAVRSSFGGGARPNRP